MDAGALVEIIQIQQKTVVNHRVIAKRLKRPVELHFLRYAAFDTGGRFVDIPGLPLEHPPYDLWCTDDGDYILLKAQVGGDMQTAYELTTITRTDCQ